MEHRRLAIVTLIFTVNAIIWFGRYILTADTFDFILALGFGIAAALLAPDTFKRQ